MGIQRPIKVLHRRYCVYNLSLGLPVLFSVKRKLNVPLGLSRQRGVALV